MAKWTVYRQLPPKAVPTANPLIKDMQACFEPLGTLTAADSAEAFKLAKQKCRNVPSKFLAVQATS